MRVWFVVILISLLGNAFSQNRKFLIHLNKAYPFVVDERTGGASRLDVFDLDREDIAGCLIDATNNWLSSEEYPILEQDSSLNKICNSAALKMRSSRFKNKVYWQREQKNFDYALKLAKVPHRMFTTYGFILDLLDLEKRDKFFFDRRVKTSDLSLYEGERPTVMNENHKDYIEPVPLSPKTESQMCQEYIAIMLKNKGLKRAKSGVYSQIGVSVRVDERSLNRKRRPIMYVVVMLSGKQSQRFADPEKIKLSLSGYDE